MTDQYQLLSVQLSSLPPSPPPHHPSYPTDRKIQLVTNHMQTNVFMFLFICLLSSRMIMETIYTASTLFFTYITKFKKHNFFTIKINKSKCFWFICPL